MVAATATLPDLTTPDEALITRLFEKGFHSLQELFSSLPAIDGAPTTLLAFFRWSQRPDIKPWLDFHESERAAALKRKHLANLDQLATTSESPIERRRASTTILRALGLGAQNVARASGPPRPSRITNDNADSDSSHETYPSYGTYTTYSPDQPESDSSSALSTQHELPSDSPLHPSTHSPIQDSPPVPPCDIPPPCPAYDPYRISKFAMIACIRRNSPGYLRAFQRFLAPNATFDIHPISEHNYPNFHPNGAYSIFPTGRTTPTSAKIRITAITPPHHIVSLTRSQDGPYANCWLISDIITDPNPERHVGDTS